MARTKASTGVKMAVAKSTKARAASGPPASASAKPSSSRKSGDKRSNNPYAGANPYKFWETPTWQKPITNFFTNESKTNEESENTGSGKETSPAKESVLNNSKDSDEENGIDQLKPHEKKPLRLRILDSSVEDDDELPELDGEDSHKIAEYFPTKPGSNDQSESSSSTDKANKARHLKENKAEESNIEPKNSSPKDKKRISKGKKRLKEEIMNKECKVVEDEAGTSSGKDETDDKNGDSENKLVKEVGTLNKENKEPNVEEDLSITTKRPAEDLDKASDSAVDKHQTKKIKISN